jgi:hypothetical protein
MSQRAYKIISIELESEPTLNLSRQTELADYLGYYSDDGNYCIEVEKLQDLLKKPRLQKELGVDAEQYKKLLKDLRVAINTGDYLIEYMAY